MHSRTVDVYFLWGTSLSTWAESTGRMFDFFREEPMDHWYPGAGIGADWHPRD
jgi:hypothetical protein